MAFTTMGRIWKDIVDGAGGNLNTIESALNNKPCFFAYLQSREFAKARACVDSMGVLSADLKTYLKDKIPS